MRVGPVRRVRFVAVASVAALVLTTGPAPAEAAAPTVAKAPAALLATSLLAASRLAAVIPGVAGKQDDGGWVSLYPETAFASEVETQSTLTHFKITLTAYGSKKFATVGYTSAVNGEPTLAGVGDRAAVAMNLQTLVLKGSQVLLVQVFTTLAGDDLIAQQGKSPQVMDHVLQQPLLAATKALAHHLNGKPATKPYAHVPVGAQDPCGVTAATLTSKKLTSVSLAGAPSGRPPAQQCDYTINGDAFLVQTLTRPQADAASPPTTLDAVYAADLAATAGNAHKTLTATIGPLRMFMVPGGDWIAEAIIESPATGAPTTAVQGALATTQGLELHPELLRVETPYTVPTEYNLCVGLFENEVQKAWWAVKAAGPSPSGGPPSLAHFDILEFCRKVSGET